MLRLLIPLEIFFKPALILLLLWSAYRTILKKDRPVGLVLYLALVIIVDSYLNTGIFIPGLEHGSIRYSEICAFFLLLNNPSTKTSGGNNRIIIFLVLLYFLLLFYSGLRGYTLGDGIFYFRRYIVPQVISVLIAYRGFREKGDYGRFIYLLIPLLLIIGLVTFWDVFFDRTTLLKSDVLNKPEYFFNRKEGRFGSLFLNPNYMGAFAVLIFPSIFVITFFEKNKWKRIYCLSGLLALAFALVETQSRGPLLSFCIAVFFFIIIPIKGLPIFKKIGFMTLFLSVFVVFMPGFFEHSIERFHALKSETAEDTVSRKTVWEYTQKIVSDHPFFGIGLGEKKYVDYMLKYDFADDYSSMPLDNPHNSYLETAVYAGIPALIIFCIYNILLVKRGISFIFNNKKENNTIYLTGFLAGIVGFLASIFVDMYMFTQNVAPVYWVLFALAYSIMNSVGRAKET